MKRIILIGIVVILFGWSLYEFIGTDDKADKGKNTGATIIATPDGNTDGENSDEIGLAIGQIAPDIELNTLDGEVVRLSDYIGKPVIVNFWATWCPPCRAEIPDFQKLYDNKDIEILAVNLTESEKSETDVADFVAEYEMTFPVLVDEDSDVSRTYEVAAYPTSYMIDSAGHIQFLAMGAMNYELMVQELEKMD